MSSTPHGIDLHFCDVEAAKRPQPLFGNIVSFVPSGPAFAATPTAASSAWPSNSAGLQGVCTILTVPSGKQQRRKNRAYLEQQAMKARLPISSGAVALNIKRGEKEYIFDFAHLRESQAKGLLKREVDKWYRSQLQQKNDMTNVTSNPLPNPAKSRHARTQSKQRSDVQQEIATPPAAKPNDEPTERKRYQLKRLFGHGRKRSAEHSGSEKLHPLSPAAARPHAGLDMKREESSSSHSTNLTYASSSSSSDEDDDDDDEDDDENFFDISSSAPRRQGKSGLYRDRYVLGPRVTFFDQDDILAMRGEALPPPVPTKSGLLPLPSATPLLSPLGGIHTHGGPRFPVAHGPRSPHTAAAGSDSSQIVIPLSRATDVGLVWWTGDLHGQIIGY